MKLVPACVVLIAAVTMSACVSLPPYVAPPAGPETATIDVSRIGNVGPICTNGNQYAIGAIKNRQLIVPANGRVAFYSFMTIADYQVSYTCHPGVSFKPEPGQTYFLNMETDSEGCTLEVYRKSDGNRIGLDVEDSTGGAQYCK